MLGFLLYEAVDLVYTLGKLGYKGVRATYYWYYDLEYPEVEQIKNKENVIEQLKKRVEMLEEMQQQVD